MRPAWPMSITNRAAAGSGRGRQDPDKPVKLALQSNTASARISAFRRTRRLGTNSRSATGRTMPQNRERPAHEGPAHAGARRHGGPVRPRGASRRQQDKAALPRSIRAPAGTKPDLFAEGPENWYFSTSPPDDRNHFAVTVEEKPRTRPAPIPVRSDAGGRSKSPSRAKSSSTPTGSRAREDTLSYSSSLLESSR